METSTKTAITITAAIKAPIEKVWICWTEPQHITKWNQASDDWHTPYAENDLRVGGKFKSTMAAKDGSFSFDFEGVYSKVDKHKAIDYTIGDGRKVAILFSGNEKETHVTSTFDAESVNSIEMQRGGWQAILNSFKKYVENN